MLRRSKRKTGPKRTAIRSDNAVQYSKGSAMRYHTASGPLRDMRKLSNTIQPIVPKTKNANNTVPTFCTLLSLPAVKFRQNLPSFLTVSGKTVFRCRSSSSSWNLRLEGCTLYTLPLLVHSEADAIQPRIDLPSKHPRENDILRPHCSSKRRTTEGSRQDTTGRIQETGERPVCPQVSRVSRE